MLEHTCQYISVRRASLSSTAFEPPQASRYCALLLAVLGRRLGSSFLELSCRHRPSLATLDPCLLAGPLSPLHPCPLLLWAGFDTRLCSLSRICRPRFTRPRVGVGASRFFRCRCLVLPIPSLGPSPSGVEHVTPSFAPCSMTLVCPPRSRASRLSLSLAGLAHLSCLLIHRYSVGSLQTLVPCCLLTCLASDV